MSEKSKESESNSDNSLLNLIHTRIENLRPKLLDLGRRNPLLSTKFSDRSHSHVRIVDELPEVLFQKINASSMRFIPLPPLEKDPKDEQNKKFRNALADGRITDEIYKKQLDDIDQATEDAADKLAQAERELKDRIREKLGMPPRQTRERLSLVQHARNNHINPSYELPDPKDFSKAQGHDDDDIQTLLLPDLLERRMSALLSKCRTWEQETGINVLRMAFGFLEWKDSPEGKSSLAPLVLLPIEIDKIKTNEGFKFNIKSLGEDAETNLVLAEKLRIDFGIQLPKFDLENINLEKYFSQVSTLTPKGLEWRIRRQATIGVFPSARMAMYHDLDTLKWSFGQQKAIQELLGGNQPTGTASPYGDEYEEKDPKIQARTPLLVKDADSSQVSTVIDVMDGKNVAVEGPPGTGKSQTIVNSIAAALAQGKKVLFVAEKMAALEVVKSRLEECDLGEFLLTLQAKRSTKEQVIQSIRNRLKIPAIRDLYQLDEQLNEYKRSRDEINDYIDIVSKYFKETGKTVYQILGSGLMAQKILGNKEKEVQQLQYQNAGAISVQEFHNLKSLCHQLEETWERARKFTTCWKRIKKSNIDQFTAQRIIDISQDCLKEAERVNDCRKRIEDSGLNKTTSTDSLIGLKEKLKEIKSISDQIDNHLINRITDHGSLEEINDLLDMCEEYRELAQDLNKHVENAAEPSIIQFLTELCEISEEIGLKNINIRTAENERNKLIEHKNQFDRSISIFNEVNQYISDSEGTTTEDIVNICDLVKATQESTLFIRGSIKKCADYKNIIFKAEEEAKVINQIKNDLNQCIVLDIIGEKNLVKECAEIFSNKHIFSFLLPKYRKAKRHYRAISKIKKFNVRVAEENLKKAFEWLSREEKFNSNEYLKETIGIRYDGINTNFELIKDLINYYDQIEDMFKSSAKAPVRDFLKNGQIDILLELPHIEDDHPIRDYAGKTLKSLLCDFGENEKREKNIERALPKIKEYSSKLKKPDELSIQTVREIIKNLKNLQLINQKISSCDQEKYLLGEHYKHTDTKAEEIDTSLYVCEKIFDIPVSSRIYALKSINQNLFEENIQLLENCIGQDLLLRNAFNRLSKQINIDSEGLFKSEDIESIIAQLKSAICDKEGLVAHSSLNAVKESLFDKGLEEILDSVERHSGTYEGTSDIIGAVILQSQAREVYEEYGILLSKYNGIKLNKLRKNIQTLDKSITKLSRKYIKHEIISTSNPPDGIGRGRKSEWTDMSLIHNEVSKTTRYIPVRELTKRASSALQAIKPCWMMSPLAVAQYIDKGSIAFDLVIIDEASQMTPEDALGAIARSSNVMVVGDTNQLPPTGFFKKFIDDSDEDPDEIVTEESILEIANSVFRPARRLKWHYRSQHPGLIAFSNKYIYENDLIVFPSSDENNADKGVEYKKVNGIYSKGTNPIEASELVSNIISFMKDNQHQSLGVVLLNQRQRDLVQQEFEYALSTNESAQKYMECWESLNDGLEAFFIKNLENVQGDERDVIFIGTVYGPEGEGAPVMQRFGPINGITGKRRLNVLFTRAKQKVITFSSMSSNDIKVKNQSNEGVELLKLWLEYSATGAMLADSANNREPDSDFERYVISQLKSMGCTPVPQVGISGYFIDIGVKHPKWPHGFIMGIECDGATYHSAKSARDRDRLRQEVLERLGWKLHRIWSTDWFNDPINESKRLRVSIENRLQELGCA